MGEEFVMEDIKLDAEDCDDIYAVGRGIAQVEPSGTTMIQIFNPSATYVRLKHDQPIAVASKIGAVKTMEHIDEADWESRLPRLPESVPENFKISSKADLKSACLTEEEKEELRNIIDYHSSAFVGPDGNLGEYNGNIRHRIDLEEGSKIPQTKIYRIPLEKREEIEKQIKLMLEQRIIQPPDSPFLAPIVLVRKADGKSWRFTVDFRGLNAITNPVQSIIPNIQEILDLCGGQELYTSLDFQSGFHQILMEPEHSPRTAFACFLGAFEYLRMPMGLKGSPGTFQRCMNLLIKEVKARIFIYIDDVIITSKDAKEHLKDIDEVLGKIEGIGMKLKVDKCSFAVNQITFLGFIVSKDGLKPDPKKTRAVSEFPIPRTVKDVRAFLGTASFYRRFVNNFSKIAAPIIELTKKEEPFVWTEERQKSFQALKDALTSEPVLVAPRLGKPFIIEVDASGKGVGAVLYQAQDEEGKDLRVVSYASRVYNAYEKNYPAIELEACGLVFAVKTFRPYIDGARTTIVTDHSPLKSLMYRKELVGRLSKYQIVLQEFDIEIIYRPGKQNIVCDTLSRYHPEDTNEDKVLPTSKNAEKKRTNKNVTFTKSPPQINALATNLNIDFERIRKEQLQDENIMELKTKLKKFKVRDDVVFIQTEGKQWIILLPQKSPYGKELAKMVHESVFESAHLGIEKTLQRVQTIATWRGMTKAVQKVVEKCVVCQQNKDSVKLRIKAPLGKFEETTSPFERVHSDYIGPLPETSKKNKYIAMFVDAYSKFIIAEPVTNQTAEVLCSVFRDRVVARFGTPKLLVTDQGTNFTSQAFRDMLKTMRIEHKMSTPYHHQANGQVERANQTVEGMLRQCEDENEWDVDLQTLVHAYNNSNNATTEVTPYVVMHGKEARSPLKNALPVEDGSTSVEEHVKNVKSNQEMLQKV
uniref:RNA-directed DNA polymerase n=2 Tax=Caenorhabditis japonica TaxID=281687 RepID=A0A8R1I4Q2_CAEJA